MWLVGQVVDPGKAPHAAVTLSNHFGVGRHQPLVCAVVRIFHLAHPEDLSPPKLIARLMLGLKCVVRADEQVPRLKDQLASTHTQIFRNGDDVVLFLPVTELPPAESEEILALCDKFIADHSYQQIAVSTLGSKQGRHGFQIIVPLQDREALVQFAESLNLALICPDQTM